MNPLEEYYRRIPHQVSQMFKQATLAVWDLGHGYLAAEALARTGLRRQHWFDGGRAGGALCRSLGRSGEGKSRSEALARHCKSHNSLEKAWELNRHGRDLSELREVLHRHAPALLLAKGDHQAVEVLRAAMDHGVPLVMTFSLAEATTRVVQLVWIPEAAVDPEQLLEATARLAAMCPLDLDRIENHVDGLEARSLALSLAKWILTRREIHREDLERPIVEHGRSLILRGSPSWPWSCRLVKPTPRNLQWIMARGPWYTPPAGLLAGQRVLVLGLGTASLLCAEAGNYFSHLVVADCKAVTAVNPVRQIYRTDQVGQPKELALTRSLMDRLEPAGPWDATTAGPVKYWRTGQLALGSVELRLARDDPSSLKRFDDILEQVRPTMVVVGMGRTQNDNFAATETLWRKGIPHITPSAFPGVTHFKQILTHSRSGPCYDCLQGHLAVDGGHGPELNSEERDIFYGGSQPATLAETYPSSHSLLRLLIDFALPRGAYPSYLARELGAARQCFVGANRAERKGEEWLYGVDRPFAMVTYGADDILKGSTLRRRCSCGRAL